MKDKDYFHIGFTGTLPLASLVVLLHYLSYHALSYYSSYPTIIRIILCIS